VTDDHFSLIASVLVLACAVGVIRVLLSRERHAGMRTYGAMMPLDTAVAVLVFVVARWFATSGSAIAVELVALVR
jgi:hypothetical protein